MEHGLQYKNSDALPYKIRRQLSSLSSLLETADSQLVLLKDFENELIDESTLSLNKEKPENVALNKITLPLFFKDKNSIIYKIRGEFLNNKSDKELNVPGVEKLADFDREGIRTLDSNLSFLHHAFMTLKYSISNNSMIFAKTDQMSYLTTRIK